MRFIRLGVTGAAALAVWLGAPGGAVAFETLAHEAKEFPSTDLRVSALGERAVWSGYRSGLGGYVLMTSVGGGPATELPIAPRRYPFDVDLGSRGGREVAAYSRCRRFNISDARSGCRIYMYDFATGEETRLEHRPRSSDRLVLPSVSGDRIAFVATGKWRRPRSEPLPAVYVAVLDGTTITHARKIGQGSLGHLGTLPDGSYEEPPFPLVVDLSDRMTAFAWLSWPGRGCPNEGPFHPQLFEIWVARDRDRLQRVARACSGGVPNELFGPTLDGDSLVYAAQRPTGGPTTNTTVIRVGAGEGATLTTDATQPTSVAIAGPWAYASLTDGRIVRFPAAAGQ